VLTVRLLACGQPASASTEKVAGSFRDNLVVTVAGGLEMSLSPEQVKKLSREDLVKFWKVGLPFSRFLSRKNSSSAGATSQGPWSPGVSDPVLSPPFLRLCIAPTPCLLHAIWNGWFAGVPGLTAVFACICPSGVRQPAGRVLDAAGHQSRRCCGCAADPKAGQRSGARSVALPLEKASRRTFLRTQFPAVLGRCICDMSSTRCM
jgi:hypothetical protein